MSQPKPVVKAVGPKVPTAADAKHKAGGGNVELHGMSKPGSAGSGAVAPAPAEDAAE